MARTSSRGDFASGSLVSLVGVATVAAVILLFVDLAWIRLVFPEAIPSWMGTLALFGKLAPVAALLSFLLGFGQGIGGMAVSGIDDWLRRRGLARRSRPATIAAAISVPLFLPIALTMASGIRHPGLVRPAIAGACVAIPVLAVWLAVRVVVRSRRILADPRTGRRTGWLGVLGAAAVGIGFVALDHTVLVRLYQPMHVCFRLGALGALQIMLLLVGISVRGNRIERGRRWRLAPLAGATSIVIAALLAGPWAAAIVGSPSLSPVHVYGGSAATLAEFHRYLTQRGKGSVASTVDHKVGTRPNAELHASDTRDPVLPGANVLLITVDALRADHLGFYGYARPTSPGLDRLAGESAVFERAYAAAPHTSFALTSLLTGRPAVALAHLDRLDGHPTLGDLLNGSGYATAAFIPPAVFFVEPDRFRSYERRQFGFRHIEVQALPEDQSAPMRTDQAIGYLDRYQPARFAAWVHYFAPHEPYVYHPDPDRPPFGSRAVDLYDGEIRWVDREISRLVEQVRARYPRTVVVVTADHGEEFGEHGGAYHGTTLFDEQIRVPLLISGPGIAPVRVATPVAALDVLPTLLGLLDIPAPARLSGFDLRPWLGNRPLDAVAASGAVVAENGATMRMIAGEGHKLICNSRWPDCMLFDLAADPRERRDLAAARPMVVGHLQTALAAWISSVTASTGPAEDKRADPSHLEAMLARARLHDRSAVPSLLDVLASRSATAQERRAAARRLSPIVRPADRNPIRDVARSEPDAIAASWLRIALTTLGDRDAAQTLERDLRTIPPNETDGDLLTNAALALANLTPTPPADLLSRALVFTQDVETRCDIFRALGRSRDRWEAARLLVADYETIRTRVCSADGLAQLAHPATLPFLVSKLPNEPYATVQLRLIEGLARIGDASAVPALLAQEESNAEPAVRAASTRAIALIRGQGGSSQSVVPPAPQGGTMSESG